MRSAMSLLRRLGLRQHSLAYVREVILPHIEEPPAPADMRWVSLATQSDLGRFPADDSLKRHFEQFRTLGHCGVALLQADEYAAYGWMSTPASPLPKHLPDTLAPSYWIYYCATSEPFRRRGLYALCLRKLLYEAAIRAAPRATVVYIDAHIENVYSRRAIERAEFVPSLHLTTFRLPKVQHRWFRCRPAQASAAER